MLVDVDCNPLAYNLRGETSLHIAAKQGYHEVVNYPMLFNSSSDVLSLLSVYLTARESTLRSLIGNADGLHFRPEEEARVFQAVGRFIDDQDKRLEMARIFIGVAGDLFARSSSSATLFEIAARRGFHRVMEYLTSQPMPLPPASLFTALRHQVSMIPPLICNGADVHVREDSGDSLTHHRIDTHGAETLRDYVGARRGWLRPFCTQYH
ncbi:hypothetical protein J3R83DRAFT_5477 [Lanmaoa asiatica]|nr:hypothetical protein J3R83DRAFT_5477 [Lanmaoa asiatica]